MDLQAKKQNMMSHPGMIRTVFALCIGSKRSRFRDIENAERSRIVSTSHKIVLRSIGQVKFGDGSGRYSGANVECGHRIIFGQLIYRVNNSSGTNPQQGAENRDPLPSPWARNGNGSGDNNERQDSAANAVPSNILIISQSISFVCGNFFLTKNIPIRSVLLFK